MNRKVAISTGAGVVVIGLLYIFFFSAPGGSAATERFVVPLGSSRNDVAQRLKDEGLIRSAVAFGLVHRSAVAPGGYHLAKTMNVFRVSRALSVSSYMTWVSIPEGSTKAEVAALLAETLDWTRAQENEFLKTDIAAAAPLSEGVYFPTTYLLPKGESVASTTARIYAKFNEEFAPYAAEALRQNIKWTTVLRLASLVQAEAAGLEDMSLVAGILWNRLLDGMRLQVDVAPDTYREAGLPAQPINNPGLGAIRAALEPEKTGCLYYIHDERGIIHCSATFAEHRANVERYLKE